MKGQVALEYLLITAFLLLAAGLIFIYSMITLDESLRLAQADKALAQMATAADTVSARGPSNQFFVTITLPAEIGSNQIQIQNKTIIVEVPTANGPNQRYATTTAQLTPTTLSTGGGISTIKIQMVDENIVFSEA